ncbi:VPA1267 family protein [Ottowia caeni]|uniref:VPA1267 family protein n=1 Tax=Ottowia caeni TaxID=2870339 RepID=UPI003D71FBE0
MSGTVKLSGQQLAEKNVQTFTTWVASKTDDDLRAIASRGVLSRNEVAKECGFAKSALDQNPRIKAALRELEDNLRLRGVLPDAAQRDPEAPQAPLTREPGRLRAVQDAERLRRLEQENAGLKAEVAELKRTVEKYSVLREALAQTGRLPR